MASFRNHFNMHSNGLGQPGRPGHNVQPQRLDERPKIMLAHQNAGWGGINRIILGKISVLKIEFVFKVERKSCWKGV